MWPSDTIWRHRSVSTLAQIMACFLTVSSHYLNQCRLIIVSTFCETTHSRMSWHSTLSSFTKSAHELNMWHVFGHYNYEITTSSRAQWVNEIVIAVGGCVVFRTYFKTHNFENWESVWMKILEVVTWQVGVLLNTSRREQNGWHFTENIFNCISWLRNFVFRFKNFPHVWSYVSFSRWASIGSGNVVMLPGKWLKKEQTCLSSPTLGS